MNSLKNIHSICRLSLRKLSTKKQTKPAFNFQLAREVSKELEAGSVKSRHHPGKLWSGTVTLPTHLHNAALRVLSEHSDKSVEKDEKKLSSYLWSRHAPLDEDHFKQKWAKVEAAIIKKETIDPTAPEMSEEIRKRLLDSRRSKVHEMMKRQTYNWSPVQYDNYMSVVYMLARLAPDYAALVKILQEIRSRDPGFSPLAMMDFGSGVGSGMWAVDGVWADMCKEAMCVDASVDMNNLADTLLRGGDPDSPLQVRDGGTFFRQFLPMSDALKYDLVLSSRSLFELPDMASRLRTIDVLWRKTSGYLVIVESGTSAGYRIVQEARDYVLNLNQAASEEGMTHCKSHVFSPCPHDEICPKFNSTSMPVCNFSVTYKPFTLAKNQSPTSDLFSYVVLKRGRREENQVWPRLVQHPLRRKRHIICRTCTSHGTLQELTATKGKHGGNCYMVCKKSSWGDLLPVVLPDPTRAPDMDTYDQGEQDGSDDDGTEQGQDKL